jgi:anti-sigma factor RsiW
MNGPNNTMPEEQPPGEELLAYLDGELDAESRRRFEQQLSTSSDLRQRLKEYQQTWDLLDDLPRATVDDSFTRTTVEMVAVRAENAVAQSKTTRVQRRSLIWSLGVLSIIATCLAGFFATWQYHSLPNEQLVEDLPILEHFDAYRNAGTLEFLRQLDEQKLFQEDSRDAI